MDARKIERHFLPGMALSPNDVVLIVDGDVGFLLWLSHALAADGYIPIGATSAAEARRLLRELSLGVAVFIVNLQLPGMFELTETLRRENRLMKVIRIQNSCGAEAS